MEYIALANRLKKRFKHLSKWAKRNELTCYRLYNRDLTEFPAIMDWIDGDVVVWAYGELDPTHLQQAICEGLRVLPQDIHYKYRGKQQGLQTQYTKLGRKEVIKTVTERGILFEVNLSDYLDIGLFLDHRNARQMIQEWAYNKRVLNLFAYTGSFTCYAINGFASHTTTVDLNPNYCTWAKRNLTLNGWKASDEHTIVQSDCIRFLNHCKETYDIIICDPPTFSNSKRGSTETFSINHDYGDLLYKCAKVLNENGMIFFSTNSTSFKLDPEQLPRGFKAKETTIKTTPEDFKGSKIHRSWILTRMT